jgi:hypothetical protein
MRTAGASCQGCHVFINPIGFGLETYDAIGTLRSKDRNKPIDASGVLPGGKTFQDTEQLLELLRNDARFPACLTEKLLTYGLGRKLNDCDKREVEELNRQFAADAFQLRNHLVRIVQSGLFRSAGAHVEVSK